MLPVFAIARATRALGLVVALVVGATGAAMFARPAAAAPYKPIVVIVVGPSGGSTADYLSHAKDYARQARKYGATVREVYTPNATWARVLDAAQGANVFIYLGHGNGWPSPYAPWQSRTKNGLGLNARAGAGNRAVKYYGEAAIAASLRLAPGAIVLLNRLCYASGSAEPGMPQPGWATAVKRVDNYGAGFLRTGASVVIADGHTSLVYELKALFGPSHRADLAWAADPDANGNIRQFASRRTPGIRTLLDPDRPSKGFYRSIALRPGAATGAIRIPAFSAVARQRTGLFKHPGGKARAFAVIGDGRRSIVRGALRADAAGRTWIPVTTRDGRTGWMAGWLVGYWGSARPQHNVVLRTWPSTRAAKRGVVKVDTRVTVIGTELDAAGRSWLRVETPGGERGWIAAWLTRY